MTTTSPALTKWFAGSKVANQAGAPLVVYHSTRADVSQFDINKSNHSNRFGPGFYFTGDQKTLDAYSGGDGGNVMPVYLNIKNPQTTEALTAEQVKSFFRSLTDKTFPNGYDATEDHLRMEARALEDLSSAFATLLSGQVSFISSADWLRGMEAIGVDGVVKTVFGHPEYVAFRPEQIKSATGNFGKFDELNPDIRFSFAGPRAMTLNNGALLDAHEEAQRRVAAGEPAEAVRQSTGWHVGVDGMWRFEFSDAKARLLPAIRTLSSGGYTACPIVSLTYRRNADRTYDLTLKPPNPQKTSDFSVFNSVSADVLDAILPAEVYAQILRGEGERDFIDTLEDAKSLSSAFEFAGFNALPLDQVLEHDLLFHAYPSLRYIMVQVDPKLRLDGQLALMDNGQTILRVGSGQQLIALLHEVQHLIQMEEKFSQGTNPDLAYAEKASTDGVDLNSLNPQLSILAERYNQMNSAWETATLAKRYKGQKAEAGALLGQRNGIEEQIKQEEAATRRKVGYDAYRRTGGEVEARNTEARQHLSDEQRRATPPSSTSDVPDAEIILSKPPAAGSAKVFKRVDPVERLPARAYATVASMNAAIAQVLGTPSSTLPNGLGGVMVVNSDQIPASWQPNQESALLMSLASDTAEPQEQLHFERLLKAATTHAAQAFYDPLSGTAAFVADRIAAGSEAAVFLHEITHKHGRPALGEPAWHALVQQINTWSTWEASSNERKIHDAAMKQVLRSGVTEPAVIVEELFAYSVELAVKMGIKPSAAAAAGSAEQWLDAVVTSIRLVGEKLTGQVLAPLTLQEVVDLSYALAQLESPNQGQKIRAAFKEALQGKKAGAFDRDLEDIRLSGADPAAPIWFSALGHAVGSAQMNTAAAKDWISFLRGLTTKGVKPDEIEWSGVEDWLALQPGKVTRQRLMEYLSTSGVQVTEIVLDDASRNVEAEGRSIKEIDPARSTLYSQYQIPGGTSYRELLLTLPQIPNAQAVKIELEKERIGALRRPVFDSYSVRIEQLKQKTQTLQSAGDEQGEQAAHDELRLLMAAMYAAADQEAGVIPESLPTLQFQSAHWTQPNTHPNVLAHVRFNERVDFDGKRVLFIEELQSDWGQQGKRRGFADAETTIDGLSASQWQRTAQDMFGKWKSDADVIFTKWQRAVHNARTLREKYEALGLTDVVEIPAAPFVTKTDAWVALALKRMISYAATNGFDRVAFISGEQSADRYDLSKKIGSVDWIKSADGTYRVVVNPVKGEPMVHRDLTEAALADTIGKDAAQKIIDGVGVFVNDPVTAINGDVRGTLDTVDLRIGGEGMKTFYSQIVPNVAKDVLKKLGCGCKLCPVAIDIPGSGDIQSLVGYEQYDFGSLNFAELKAMNPGTRVDKSIQQGFDITVAMRERVMMGMPLFSLADTEEEGLAEYHQAPH